MVRALSLMVRARSNRSPMRSAAPISSASWARSCSRGRPVIRWSSVRTSSNRVYACRSPPPGESGRNVAIPSVSWAIASASSMCTSRRPPRPYLRSGSARCAMSPLRRHRSRAWSTSAGNRERMSVRHCCRTPPISSFESSSSPAMCRASSRPNAAVMSLAATWSACGTVRTLWSSLMWASQSGYQI